METIECPDGDTRTEKEIIVKIIVAHFTAIVAFCNFQSLRNERLDTVEPLLFLLSPLIVIVQTGLGLGIIAISFLKNLAISPKLFRDHLATVSRRWTTLFGTKSRDTPTGSRLGRAWIRLGRTLAIFATLFQFAATIFLYRRRKELHGWEALTIVDHRTFELSVGGAAVSILSLALLLKFPGFGQVPESPYTPEIKADTDTKILFCRGDSRRCPSWYQILYATDIGSATSAATWLACVASSTYKGESLPLSYASSIYSGIYRDVSHTLSLDVSMPIFYLLVAIFFAIFFTSSHLYKDSGFFKRLGDNLWLLIPALLITIVAMIAFMCMVLLMMVPISLFLFPSVLSGPGCIFTMKGLEIRDTFSQPPFRVLTNETDCLLLWKDPVAEYLWSLV
ncbi:uncharacterized protein B0J16DRAFT_351021 [Fusarium flagelliforme]|uniref:uncharacterized protein n=1 Tax=Fusarium flagelliforme TaxID=2675880 RepID=UPI001E8D0124|nr:uncharacterized protein B0J16DRAFT_351021 [Fusarium flagelliforme]KAH7173865.1 hypothetical protein B0J16DRAFT_351021 [Fusarium flagelliforme]